MLKAGALIYAVILSLVIAILTSSLILYSSFSGIGLEKMEIADKLRLNSASGLQLLLSDQEMIPENSGISLDLYARGTDSVKLSRKTWGVFEILSSEALHSGDHAELLAMSGTALCNTPYCLYLSDQDRPLALCGNTVLKGNAYLPKSGIKRAYIEGQNFTGSAFVQGTISNSNSASPAFSKSLFQSLSAMFSSARISEEDSLLSAEAGILNDSVTNGFRGETLLYSSAAAITIAEGSYIGNIAVISSSSIRVLGTASLDQVILAAPKIIIEKKFKGSLQAFATDSIILMEDVNLSYPSVLGLAGTSSGKPSCIQLHANDSVSGSIIALKQEENVQPCLIIIPRTAFIQGEVYTNSYADHQGTIHGSLTCKQLLLRTPSSVYENHLLGAVIDATLLPAHFSGGNFREGYQPKRIVQYLK